VQRFHHQALPYRDLADLLDQVVPFVREGVERDEPVLVAQPRDRIAALRLALGPEAQAVRFLDMAAIGRNPACIIPAWRDFLDKHPPGTPVRGVGEPVWSGRRPAELAECALHEALLNLAFEDGPGWQLLCPYDAAALPEEVLAEALRTHPFVGAGPGRASERYTRGGQDARTAFAGSLPAPPADATAVGFGLDDLAALRALVRRTAEAAGVSTDVSDDLVLASHELASNSILHGGGEGVLRTWRTGEALCVEIDDAGVITDPLVGRESSGFLDETGRGLWMANQLCDLVQVRSSARGTTVRLHTWL
jgi:anti-sigma regulatory factor (Ser/Thr protein kinase)